MMIDGDIAELDLAPIAYKVCRDEGWPLARVDRVEEEYRAFLQLIREDKNGNGIGPTKEIDIFWHHHILDTRKYMDDCRRIFGSYLHHYPYSGIFGEEDAVAQSERVAQTKELVGKIICN